MASKAETMALTRVIISITIIITLHLRYTTAKEVGIVATEAVVVVRRRITGAKNSKRYTQGKMILIMISQVGKRYLHQCWKRIKTSDEKVTANIRTSSSHNTITISVLTTLAECIAISRRTILSKIMRYKAHHQFIKIREAAHPRSLASVSSWIWPSSRYILAKLTRIATISSAAPTTTIKKRIKDDL